MLRTAAAAVICCLGVAAGAFTVDLASDAPGYWFAGRSWLDALVLLGAGWTLIGAGLATWARRIESRFGLLLAASGFAWFLLEWNNPAIGSPLAFTAGLCLYASCPPLVAHAVLATGHGRSPARLESGGVALGYLAFVLLLGVVPALFFDPDAQGCAQCPRNLLLVADRPGLASDLTRTGVALSVAAVALLTCLTAWRLMQSSTPPRRALLSAGTLYLAFVGTFLALSLEGGMLENGTGGRWLWLAQAAALFAIGSATAWVWIRLRRARSEVARLVVDLAEAPPPGRLRDVLATIVHDPSLVVAYPVDGSDVLVDAQGRPVEVPAQLARTTLARGGRPLAVLAHAPGLLGDDQLVHEATGAARLALENERLQAEVHVRLDELRRSRGRIVDAADAERRRLERDLHDGAQQRLVGLALTLELVRSRLPAGSAGAAALAAAGIEVRAALEELRDVAHGIFPAVLADEGLTAAIEALAEEARVPMSVRGLPDERFPAPVETAAYTVVAELSRAATRPLVVAAVRADGALVLDIETAGVAGADLVGLRDRVRAVEGRLTIEAHGGGRTAYRAEFPCAS